jgi:choline dehydrogenase-like flavoprotein
MRVLRSGAPPADYDGWAALGNPGWAFTDVLDDFRRLESDVDFTSRWHGSDGPIPVRRHPRNELNTIQTAFLDGATAMGHPYIEDHNQRLQQLDPRHGPVRHNHSLMAATRTVALRSGP